MLLSTISFSSIKAVHSKGSQDHPTSPSSSGSPSPPGNTLSRFVNPNVTATKYDVHYLMEKPSLLFLLAI
jgi:hypothetical protein